jgi:Flp pilus assembly protein TadD
MKALKLLCLPAAILLATTAAQAQRTSMQLNGVTLTLSSRERAVLTALQDSIDGHDAKLQDNALAAARRDARSHDALYVFALYEDEIAKQRNDTVLRTEALDALIASDMTPPDRLPSYLSVRGFIAYQKGDLATADTLWTRVVALKPSDADALSNLAQVRSAQGDSKGAAALLERSVAAQGASHQPASEATSRQLMVIAFEGGEKERGIAAAHALVRAYPTAANWRDALVVYRQLAQLQGGLEIDLMRLMRATGTLVKGDEYLRMAQLLEHAGHLAEARAVMDEGVTRSILDPLESHTRAISAEIDRKLQQQPPPPVTPDASAAETSLHQGVALAQAGKRDEAKAIFATVTAPDADLATFWIDWLAH